MQRRELCFAQIVVPKLMITPDFVQIVELRQPEELRSRGSRQSMPSLADRLLIVIRKDRLLLLHTDSRHRTLL